MRGRRSASYVSSANGTPSGRPPVRAKQRAIAAASSIACEPPWKAVGCARERNQHGRTIDRPVRERTIIGWTESPTKQICSGRKSSVNQSATNLKPAAGKVAYSPSSADPFLLRLLVNDSPMQRARKVREGSQEDGVPSLQFLEHACDRLLVAPVERGEASVIAVRVGLHFMRHCMSQSSGRLQSERKGVLTKARPLPLSSGYVQACASGPSQVRMVPSSRSAQRNSVGLLCD